MCVCILYKHRDPKLLPEFFDRCCKGMVEVSYPCPPGPSWRHRSRQAAHLGDSALYRLGTNRHGMPKSPTHGSINIRST